MMKLSKYSLVVLVAAMTLYSCKNDDDSSPNIVPPRDEAEVAAENDEEIRAFLETHFYEMVPNPLNPNYQIIKFDTIAGDNSGKQPIMNSEFLETKTIVQNEIDYTVYYLKIREGVTSQRKPNYADLVIVTYRGQLLSTTKFDERVSPTRLSLFGTIKGFSETLNEFRGATDYIVNQDNTITFSDDFGIGATFVPSGLAYFADPPSGSIISSYDPLIFTFQLYKTIQGDHDEDSVPSIYEDLNNDKLLNNDNTDGDDIPNFADADDDGDGTPTIDEVEINDANEDGYISEDEITFTDSNNDGTPDYLDPEVN